MSPLRTSAFVAFVVLGASLVGCGPTQEEKDLAVERVALLELQHAALGDGGDCAAIKERMKAFEATAKDRIEKTNKAWTALTEERKSKAREAAAPKKEISDARTAIIVKCGGDTLPVK